MAPVQRCRGAQSLRYRLVLAHISGRTLRCAQVLSSLVSRTRPVAPSVSTHAHGAHRVDDLRVDDPSPGLRDYEANLLRLLEKVTNGTLVEINETGARRERGHVARRASV